MGSVDLSPVDAFVVPLHIHVHVCLLVRRIFSSFICLLFTEVTVVWAIEINLEAFFKFLFELKNYINVLKNIFRDESACRFTLAKQECK